ncbi:MAG: adenosylmethionine decarboxylase [Rhizobiales bacterium]|nr:adenosylmethionine decarboxylase [Hyphomicrobiales bacterium]
MSESNALFQTGDDLTTKSGKPRAEVLEFPVSTPARGLDHDAIAAHETLSEGPRHHAEDRKDFFIVRDGVKFAGTHLIIDLIGASRLDDIAYIEAAIVRCVEVSKATLLHIHLHHFTPNGGVSGVAVLSESHISIHTWPEADYAALDVFMCGDAEPHNAIEVLREAFTPSDIRVDEHRRGSGMV